MYVITVIPIQKSQMKEYLTYFSNSNITLGSIVLVPVRSKNINAIVINTEIAKNIKFNIKNADYKLKKITKVKGSSPFTESFFIACEKMKNYTVSNTGSVIRALLPLIYIENIHKLKEYNPIKNQSYLKNTPIQDYDEIKQNIKQEKLIFQTSINDRLAFYRTLIREAFAKKESVFICMPTHYDIEQYKNELAKGIERYVFTFHSEMTKKNLIDKYNSSINESHPILIIGTGTFLFIPRLDIKTIIIEHESSNSYKQPKRPFLDIRSFAEIFSSVKKIKLIFGDTILRPETLYRYDKGELGEICSPLFRLPQAEHQIIIDARGEIEEKNKKTFTILSEKTKDIIKKAVDSYESIFLFSVRKGLAPLTLCQDCGNTLLCKQCDTPMVLYGSKQLTSTKTITPRIFMCNKCGEKEKTEIRCSLCSSWNLIPLGIGTDRVYEEIKNLFPKSHIIQIDRETTTNKEAREAIKLFSKNPGSILIGTEMVFSYLQSKVNHSAIISLDGLLSIPSFNITQKILHIIEKLHHITSKNLIIQTRLPENKILQHILSGNVLPLYREDLEERKLYEYPPFKRLIKITFLGTKTETAKARTQINSVLGEYDPQIYSAFVGKIKGQYITNTVIKVDPKLWSLSMEDNFEINSHLAEILLNLPPSFSINVDPEDLL